MTLPAALTRFLQRPSNGEQIAALVLRRYHLEHQLQVANAQLRTLAGYTRYGKPIR